MIAVNTLTLNTNSTVKLHQAAQLQPAMAQNNNMLLRVKSSCCPDVVVRILQPACLVVHEGLLLVCASVCTCEGVLDMTMQ